MRLSLALLLSALACVAGREMKNGATCEEYSKDKDTCLKTSENGVPCSYCNSAAVGGLCAPETDTKDLPPSVFACEYQNPLKVKATETCEEYSKDKDTCLKTSENGVPCSYCNSAAVGGLCAPETDTKDLPPSVFACDYQVSAFNATATKGYGSMPDTCWTDFDKCLDSCPTPTSGATCDSEISGVNSYWCCHNPSPGCYSNYNDAMSHCYTKIVSKVDDYYYCCVGTDCCNYGDKSCDVGDVCCLSGCNNPDDCSYTQSGCSGAYGASHSCQWDSKADLCIVGK